MDDPIEPISDELKKHLPPDPDGPARQRDLLAMGQLIDRGIDKINRRFDSVSRRFDQLEALIIRESARNQEQFAMFKAETFDRMTRSYYMVLGLMVTLNGAILSFTAAVLFG